MSTEYAMIIPVVRVINLIEQTDVAIRSFDQLVALVGQSHAAVADELDAALRERSDDALKRSPLRLNNPVLDVGNGGARYAGFLGKLLGIQPEQVTGGANLTRFNHGLVITYVRFN